MNRRLISVILFGVVIAGVASFVLYHLMMSRVASGNAPAVATTRVSVATRNLDPGEIVKEADVKIAPWSGPPPAGSLTKTGDVVGRSITASIYAGEPIIEARLAPVGSGGGLAAMIPEGMRAVAIHVNEVVGVAGFVVAGTHVDVLVSGSRPGTGDGPGDTVTRTILQDITVLSAGQDYKQTADGKPATVQVVNLLVTPQQAETLSLAGSQATVQLVLRNPLDKQKAETGGVALSSILGAGPRPAVRLAGTVAHHPAVQPAPIATPAPPSEEAFAMEIIQGNKRTEIRLQPTKEAR